MAGSTFYTFQEDDALDDVSSRHWHSRSCPRGLPVMRVVIILGLGSGCLLMSSKVARY